MAPQVNRCQSVDDFESPPRLDHVLAPGCRSGPFSAFVIVVVAQDLPCATVFAQWLAMRSLARDAPGRPTSVLLLLRLNTMRVQCSLAIADLISVRCACGQVPAGDWVATLGIPNGSVDADLYAT